MPAAPDNHHQTMMYYTVVLPSITLLVTPPVHLRPKVFHELAASGSRCKRLGRLRPTPVLHILTTVHSAQLYML